MRRLYVEHNFRDDTLEMIYLANEIIEEYQAQGFDLTLRQLYYQMVSRDYIPNNQRSYKRLGSILSDARRAGLVDWEAIVDRTRNLRAQQHWNSPRDILNAAVASYHRDHWQNQTARVEVWIEKDALIGVITGVCQRWDVPYFACRGYVSDSEMWAAGQRIRRNAQSGQGTLILHLGDHDPSGIDMTRDIESRLALFSESPAIFSVHRLALNMGQIEQYNPPPNPAKLSDSRADGYIEAYGYDSWELDALAPSVLAGLINDTMEKIIDVDAWAGVEAEEAQHRAALKAAADSIQL